MIAVFIFKINTAYFIEVISLISNLWDKLKAYFIYIFSFVNNKYKIIFKKPESFIKESIFYSLNPRDDVDEENIYYNKFMTSINNDCKTIAFTGGYGVGKSSIINSILKKLNNSKKYIKISLGNYKECPETEGNNSSDLSTFDTSNDIEARILQQIIYTKNEKKLPQSRFKRIKYFSKLENFIYMVVSIIIMLLVYVYYSSFYKKILLKIYDTCLLILPKFMCVSIYICTIILCCYIVFKLIKISMNTIKNISHLKYKNIDIEFNDSNKSIFNMYLDEIVYFFKQTKTNILIIEDLDRYGNVSLQVFKRLKELNYLLNANENIKKRGGVIFIYALRDDLFLNNEDRVKFFDCIIPIVSKFSIKNSKEYINKLYKEFQQVFPKIKIEDKLLKIISMYICDRRLLLNIFMEYKTYIDVLKDNQDINYSELFALICYKNINPNDFEKRLKKQGDLYNLFCYKSRFKNILNSELVSENKEIAEEIDQMKKSKKINVDDLKKVFLTDILKSINSYNINWKEMYINIDGRSLTFDDFLNENIDFTHKRNSKFCYKYNGYSEHKINDELVSSFVDKIEKLNYDFESKNKIIESNVKLIEKNNEKTMSEILDIDGFEELLIDKEFKELFKNKLLISLIKNGYIKENFEKNLSYFMTGETTPNDYNFMISVDTNDRVDFDYLIDNVKDVVKSLEVIDFKKESILNYYIVDELIFTNDKKSTAFVESFKNITDYKIKFLNSYMSYNKNNFIILLKKVISCEIVKFILNDKKIIQDIYEWFKIILCNIEINYSDEIILSIKELLSTNLSVLNQIEFNSTFKKNLLIILPDIEDYSVFNKNIIEYIYDNDVYIENRSFYEKILIIYNIDARYLNTNFIDSLYNNPKLDKFKNIVLHENAFEKLYNTFNVFESSVKNIISILNNPDVKKTNKLLIIKREKFLVENIIEIDDTDIWQDIFYENKCKITMNNLYNYYSLSNEIDEIVINMLNNINDNYEVIEDKNFNEFEKKLLYIDEAKIEDFTIIASKFSTQIVDFDETKIINKKLLDELIKHNKIIINTNIYNKLLEGYSAYLISLIKNNVIEFINVIPNIELSYDIINNVLSSDLALDKKILFLDKIDINKINDKVLSKFVFELIENNVLLNKNIVSNIYDNLNEADKIIYFCFLYNQNDMYVEYLYKINSKISKIRDGVSNCISLENNEINLKFVKLLYEKKIINSYNEVKNNIRISYSKKKIIM